jgi:hypothetical protein
MQAAGQGLETSLKHPILRGADVAHKKNGFRTQLSAGSNASPSHTMVGVAGGGGVMAAAGMLKGRVVVALYTYQGSEFGDMTFTKGDQVRERTECISAMSRT